MLNINEVRLMGVIEKIGELKQASYSMIDIVMNIKQLRKINNKWQNVDKKVNVIFFGKDAEYIANLSAGINLFVMGEVETRFKEYNGKEYANTNIIVKKFQEINVSDEFKNETSQSINLDTFNDDIPF